MLSALSLFIVATAAAGFLFTDKYIPYSYSFPRDDGQRFYLRVVLFGFPFTILAILLSNLSFLIPIWLDFKPLIFIEKDNIPLYTALSPPVIAWCAAGALNYCLTEEKKAKAFKRAMQKDDFDAILWESMKTLQPIAISLNNRKVYVGILADGFEPSSNSYITIIPLLSGYRTEDTLKFNVSTAYNVVFNLLENLGEQSHAVEEIRQYHMAFPRSSINSLHLWNSKLYQQVSQDYDTTSH
ncbi:MAG: hypothetical protein K6L73_08450 [Cellvibrionaceae bacterium]